MRVKIMEDKTPIYLLSIVGIVALVAVVYMLTGTTSVNTNAGSDSLITGNVVDEEIAPVNIGGFGRFIVGIVLIGASVYMYKKWE
jgi:hypothetical protein